MNRRLRTLRPADDRPIIGVEFVDVVANWSEAVAAAIKQRDNLTFDRAELQSPHFHRLLLGDDENFRRLRWWQSLRKNPEFLLMLQPVPGFFEFWNAPCLQGCARRIVLRHGFDEAMVRQWLSRYQLEQYLNVTKTVDGWQRQTRARWFVGVSPDWLASVEEQAIAFQAPGAAGVAAQSFFDIEQIICQSRDYE